MKQPGNIIALIFQGGRLQRRNLRIQICRDKGTGRFRENNLLVRRSLIGFVCGSQFFEELLAATIAAELDINVVSQLQPR